MKKIALIGIAAAAALLVGCSSTQCRDDKCDSKIACSGECDGNCEGNCEGEACATECNHANSTFECPNCETGKACCADCAKKMAEMCPDCAAKKSAHACPNCKDGEPCAHCAA